MIPSDPVMRLSFINLKLRDYYGSFDEMCDDLEEDRDELTAFLESAGYHYDPKTNSFK